MNTAQSQHAELEKKQDATLPTRVIADPLSNQQRAQISSYQIICSFILQQECKSKSAQIEAFGEAFEKRTLPISVQESLSVVRGKKKHICPDRATLYRWLKDYGRYQEGNTLALTKQYKGRQRKTYGWELKAIELYNMPTKPGYADVAFWLRTDYGFDSATKKRVTSFLKTLPATLGKQSPERMGKHFYRQNLAPHKIRDLANVPVGFCYEGDGHTVDVYVAHPNTGNLFRPELTIWIDVKSRYVVGWYLCFDESAIDTLFALSEAILSHDHVPAMVHVDNGSGFRARMMNDRVTGFYSRLGIDPMFAIPGNSKGKGLVEGFFKLFRNRHDKKELFKGCYCGDDMAPEVIRRLPELVKRGKRTLPSIEQYAESVGKFICDYNNEPKKALNSECPAEVWQRDLEQFNVHIAAEAMVRPREMRTVKKHSIRHQNRFYSAPELAQYNNEEVIIEYSMHHDGEIRVLEMCEKERLICIAKLRGKIKYLPDSRLEEKRLNSEKAAVKRLENKIEETRLRNRPILSHEDSADVLDGLLADEAPKALENDDFDPMDSLYLGGPDNDEGDDDLDIDATFGL